MAETKFPRVVGEWDGVRAVQVDETYGILEAAMHRDAMGVYSDWRPLDVRQAGVGRLVASLLLHECIALADVELEDEETDEKQVNAAPEPPKLN